VTDEPNNNKRTDPAYLEWKERNLEFYEKQYDSVGAESLVWMTEAMKHIALIDLAGLAGVFALLSNNSYTGDALWLPAVLFAVSSVIVVAAMYTGAHTRDILQRHYVELITKLRNDKLSSSEQSSEPAWLNFWNKFAYVAGITSALLAIIAGLLLFKTMAGTS
jgi:hypothetical protein